MDGDAANAALALYREHSSLFSDAFDEQLQAPRLDSTHMHVHIHTYTHPHAPFHSESLHALISLATPSPSPPSSLSLSHSRSLCLCVSLFLSPSLFLTLPIYPSLSQLHSVYILLTCCGCCESRDNLANMAGQRCECVELNKWNQPKSMPCPGPGSCTRPTPRSTGL